MFNRLLPRGDWLFGFFTVPLEVFAVEETGYAWVHQLVWNDILLVVAFFLFRVLFGDFAVGLALRRSVLPKSDFDAGDYIVFFILHCFPNYLNACI